MHVRITMFICPKLPAHRRAVERRQWCDGSSAAAPRPRVLLLPARHLSSWRQLPFQPCAPTATWAAARATTNGCRAANGWSANASCCDGTRARAHNDRTTTICAAATVGTATRTAAAIGTAACMACTACTPCTAYSDWPAATRVGACR